MKVFLDTNVALDVFARRAPFYADSARVWALAEQGKVRGLVSAVSLTTLYYVVRRLASRAAATDMLRVVRRCVGISACDSTVMNEAIDAGFQDFEDAVQYFSARAANADVLVTRNMNHFPAAEMPVTTPAVFLAANAFE